MADTTTVSEDNVSLAIKQFQDNAFNYGDKAIEEAFDRLQDASNAADLVNWINRNGIPNVTVDAPMILPLDIGKGDIPRIDGADSAQFLDDWMSKYRLIMNEHFSKLLSFDMAEEELENILKNGYIVNKNINNQILSRTIDSEIKKTSMLKDEALTTFVSRGYTIPDGVLNARIEKINNQYNDNVSNIIRDIALKEEDLNTDMFKYAMEKALALKPQAIQIATDFSSKYAQMYNFGAENARAYIQGLGVVSSSINNYENSLTSRWSRGLDDIRDTRNYDLNERNSKAKMDMDKVDVKARTALGSADIFARIGSAAIAAQTSVTQLYAGVNTQK